MPHTPRSPEANKIKVAAQQEELARVFKQLAAEGMGEYKDASS